MYKRTTTNAGIPILLAVILVSAFILALGDRPARAEEQAEEAEERAEERAEEAEERAEERAEEARERAEEKTQKARIQAGSGERGPENVTLKGKGEKGAEYSGTCTAGDKEEDIGGQVPQSFEYELEGEQLECEITKRSGTMKIVLTGDGTRALQRVSSQGGTFNLVYDGNGGVSFSTSSSGSSSRQVVSSSSSA
jgi:hypothetical protein